MQISSVNVNSGDRSGILTVGELVYNVLDHPLFITTPPSYVKHGRLRECHCDCGQMVLYSENVLSTHQIKSCGCLRRKRREESHYEREEREKLKIYRRDLNYKISVAQARLRFLQSRPSHLRGSQEWNLEVKTLAAELRKLFALKAHVTRKEKLCPPRTATPD